MDPVTAVLCVLVGLNTGLGLYLATVHHVHVRNESAWMKVVDQDLAGVEARLTHLRNRDRLRRGVGL